MRSFARIRILNLVAFASFPFLSAGAARIVHLTPTRSRQFRAENTSSASRQTAPLHTFPASSGWQMVSAPYVLTQSFTDLGLNAAAWKPATSQYAVSYQANPTPPADAFQLGQGYWIYQPQPVSIPGPGTPAGASFGIDLQIGWNQVGNPFSSPVPLSNMSLEDDAGNSSPYTTVLANGTVSAFFPYDSVNGEYLTLSNASDTLNPWIGAWVYSTVVTTLVISPTPVPPIPTAGSVTGFLFSGPDASRNTRQHELDARTVSLAYAPVGGRPTRVTLPASEFTIGPVASPPAGLQPVQGATISIQGLNVSTLTGQDGSFKLVGIPAGSQVLQCATGNLIGTLPLTVVANEALNLGSQKMNRSDALQMLPGAAFSQLSNPETILVEGSQQPLPSGTVLSTEDPLHRPGFEQTSLTSPAWLFYVDPFPTSGFGHPVKHVLVDDQTGAVTVMDRSYWPRLNQVDLWASFQPWDGADVIHSPTVGAGATLGLGASPQRERTVSAVVTRNHVTNCPNPKTYAIFITGTNAENDKSGKSAAAFEIAAGKVQAALNPAESRSIVPLPRTDFSEAYRVAFKDLNAKMGPCDTLFIYTGCHGGWDETTNSANGSIMYKRTDTSLGEDQVQWVSGSELVLPIRKLNACHLVFVIEACFSSSMLSQFRQGFNSLPAGVEATVVVSTNSQTTCEFRAPATIGNQEAPSLGGGFSNELIAQGLIGLDPDVLASKFQVLKSTAGTVSNKLGADVYYRAPTGPAHGPLDHISPPTPVVAATASAQLTGQDKDGRPIPATEIAWVSANPSVAKVGADGTVQGIAAGTSIVTATQIINGTGASTIITVGCPPRGPENGYIFTDLGSVPADASLLPGAQSAAYSINALGEVVGESASPDGAAHAFVWDAARGMKDLGVPDGYLASHAYGINDSNLIVGDLDTPTPQSFTRAYALGYDPMTGTVSARVDLTPAPGDSSHAAGVNKNGQIVGWWRKADGIFNSDLGNPENTAVVVWQNGAFAQDLSTGLIKMLNYLPFAAAINDNGQVVGNLNASQTGNINAAFRTGSNTPISFSASLGGLIPNPNAPGVFVDGTTAYGINASGFVVGQSAAPTRRAHAFLYDSTGMHDLDIGDTTTPPRSEGSSLLPSRGRAPYDSLGSDALAINNSGKIVGARTSDTGEIHATIWLNGKMIDLNSFIDPNAGYVLRVATAINDCGQIVGVVRAPNGSLHAFLLTPRPM